MGKRGLLIKTIELVFAAVLFMVFVGILVKLVTPVFEGGNKEAIQGLERYVQELNDLKNDETLAVLTPSGNYTIGFYAPTAIKPEKCERSACVCVFESPSEEAKRRELKCTKISGIARACTDNVRCFKQEKILVNKQPQAQPEPIYFCQENWQITITKNRAEC